MQNKSVDVFATDVKVPVAGSHTVAVRPPFSGGPSQNMT